MLFRSLALAQTQDGRLQAAQVTWQQARAAAAKAQPSPRLARDLAAAQAQLAVLRAEGSMQDRQALIDRWQSLDEAEYAFATPAWQARREVQRLIWRIQAWLFDGHLERADQEIEHAIRRMDGAGVDTKLGTERALILALRAETRARKGQWKLACVDSQAAATGLSEQLPGHPTQRLVTQLVAHCRPGAAASAGSPFDPSSPWHRRWLALASSSR